MNRYTLQIGTITLNPTVPPEAVRASGGGREVREQVSIGGQIIRSVGHKQAIRVQIGSPGPEWALLDTQIAALQALHASTQPFPVTLGEGYAVSGSFAGCTFDGDAWFEPKRAAGYSGYSFTIYIPQGA